MLFINISNAYVMIICKLKIYNTSVIANAYVILINAYVMVINKLISNAYVMIICNLKNV